MRRIDRYRREFEQVLPRIERHAGVAFRDVRCPARKDDLVAEAVALSWAWWVRLRRRGKRPQRFVGAIATFAARAVRSGRRLCGQERARDALSPLAQRRHAFAVLAIPAGSPRTGDPLADALRDNTRTPPDEQAGFRLDFPAWVAGYAPRDRRIIAVMLLGEGTTRIARRFSVSPARVSQLRRQYRADWRTFVGDRPCT
jgi:hypothetical protein